MKSILLSSFLLLAFAFPAAAQKGGVAVLDIDEVAKQLGVEEKVRVDLLTMQNNLNADLKRTQETMQKQMAGVEQAAGEDGGAAVLVAGPLGAADHQHFQPARAVAQHDQ
jgi:Skp family chaperone for outer membrane proteins